MGEWNRKSLALVLAASLLAVSGCTTTIVGAVRGSGTLTSETREVAGFSRIVLEGSGRVEVDITGTESLTIEAEDNLMPHLTSEVVDGTLVLGTNGVIVPSRDIVYTITASALDGLSISGSGQITAGEIGGDALDVEIEGAGSIDLTVLELSSLEASISGSGVIDVAGSAGDLEVAIPGSGSFDGSGLEALSGRVDISGSGNAVVNVSESLVASVSGSGAIKYLGNPEVQSDISGSGSVKPG